MDETRSRTPVVPTYDRMIWPTLQALKQLGNSATIREIENKVIELERFSDTQLSVLHGNGPATEIAYRLGWSRSYLGLDGALENSARGIWAITERGLALNEADIPALVERVKRRRPANRVPGSGRDLPHEQASPEAASPVDDIVWQEQLLNALQAMRPDAFERLCQRVLRESGFTSVQVTGRSGDGGIDGIGVLRLSLLSFQVLFQCKRYAGNVGPGMIRDFRGAMVGRTDKGLLITTGSFSAEAKREAGRDGAPPIELIDGNDLCMLLKNASLGVSTRQIEAVTVDKTWFDAI